MVGSGMVGRGMRRHRLLMVINRAQCVFLLRGMGFDRKPFLGI